MHLRGPTKSFRAPCLCNEPVANPAQVDNTVCIALLACAAHPNPLQEKGSVKGFGVPG